MMPLARTRLARTCLIAGPAAVPPLILLHGFTGDSTAWSDLVPFLGPERPVWAVDLVGHGHSPAPADPAAYTMPAVVASVAAAARAEGVARAHWLGYSMGGRVALHLALAEPALVASLILVGASPGIPDPEARARRRADDAELAALLRQEGIEAFVERWMDHPLFASQSRLGPAHLERMRAQRLRNRPEALARVLEGLGTGTMEPLAERLGAIRAPVLLMAGAEDLKFAALARRMAARLPRAELAILPGAGHAVQVEAPRETAGQVEAFLRRAVPG